MADKIVIKVDESGYITDVLANGDAEVVILEDSKDLVGEILEDPDCEAWVAPKFPNTFNEETFKSSELYAVYLPQVQKDVSFVETAFSLCDKDHLVNLTWRVAKKTQ